MSQDQAKRLPPVVVTLLCVVCLAVVVALGLWIGAAAGQDALDESAAVDRATPVGLIAIEMEDEILVQRQFLGRLEAWQSSELGFEFGGKVDAIAVGEGDRVRKGDTLVSLQMDALTSERTALQTGLTTLQTQFASTQERFDRINELVRRGLASSAQLNQLESERGALETRLIDIESDLQQIDLQMAKSRLTAPFDGIIGAIGANLGETVTAGQPIVTIFESGGADIRVGLPTSLDPRMIVNPTIDVDGQTYDVMFKAVRPDIDFRTNTRTAIFTVEAMDLDDFGLTATLSGEVSLPLRGAWVPVEAMRPSAEGYWIVLAVNDAMIAERVAVEVQYLREDKAYVLGAFETGTQIIGAGAHKVVPGQTVRAQ